MKIVQEFVDRGYAETYSVPDINIVFKSAAHRVENFPLGATASGDGLIEAVMEGRKPLAFLDMPEDHYSSVNALTALHGSGLPFLSSLWQEYNQRFYSFCCQGYIKDTVDLDALQVDYASWFSSRPDVLEYITEALLPLYSAQWEQYLCFSAVEADYRFPASYARSGLLFGYDHRTSAALIGYKNNMSGFATTLF